MEDLPLSALCRRFVTVGLGLGSLSVRQEEATTIPDVGVLSVVFLGPHALATFISAIERVLSPKPSSQVLPVPLRRLPVASGGGYMGQIALGKQMARWHIIVIQCNNAEELPIVHNLKARGGSSSSVIVMHLPKIGILCGPWTVC